MGQIGEKQHDEVDEGLSHSEKLFWKNHLTETVTRQGFLSSS